MRRIALLVCLVTGAAAAQPATVDGELALALLNLEDGSDLVAGGAPEDLLPFLPEGATVVGSVRGSSRQGGWFGEETDLTRMIGWVSGEPDGVARAYQERSYSGRVLRDDTSALNRDGGFASVQAKPMRFTYYPESQEGSVVHVSLRERPWGGTYVTVYQRPLVRGEAPADGTEGSEPLAPWTDTLQSSLPQLVPPPGETQQTRGSMGGVDQWTSRATLSSGLALDAVADHYGRQLAEAGWVSGARAMAESAITTTWTRETDGGALAAMFYAHRSEPDHVELAITVLGPDR